MKYFSKYITDETLDLFVELLHDKSRSVRRNSVRALGRHGNKNHLGYLDDIQTRDPIIERSVRAAKKNIIDPPKKSKKTKTEKELEKLNQKLDNIREIIN